MVSCQADGAVFKPSRMSIFPGSRPGLGEYYSRCKNLALYIRDCESLCLSDETVKSVGPFYLDTSSIPVPETKFKGSEGERLGQLVVTPEVVVSKITNMKENKSPGVDGISPKILKETVEQISTPLAQVFNMSLKEGIVPFEWKEANIIPLFKKGSRTSR